jgi:hypothetical protein
MRQLAILGGLMLAALFVAPVAAVAADHRGEANYYDRDARDYHNWNGDEDRQYRAYLVERHRAYVPFIKVRVRERQEYFRYRHEHGLKIVVR